MYQQWLDQKSIKIVYFFNCVYWSNWIREDLTRFSIHQFQQKNDNNESPHSRSKKLFLRASFAVADAASLHEVDLHHRAGGCGWYMYFRNLVVSKSTLAFLIDPYHTKTGLHTIS